MVVAAGAFHYQKVLYQKVMRCQVSTSVCAEGGPWGYVAE